MPSEYCTQKSRLPKWKGQGSRLPPTTRLTRPVGEYGKDVGTCDTKAAAWMDLQDAPLSTVLRGVIQLCPIRSSRHVRPKAAQYDLSLQGCLAKRAGGTTNSAPRKLRTRQSLEVAGITVKSSGIQKSNS